MRSWTRAVDSPYRAIATAFLVWKAVLLVVAASSPGLGYDTSTSLVLSDGTAADAGLPPILRHLIGKLTRWDAIYYVKVANRGYLFEQEWAFGWGFTRLIALITTGLELAGIPHYDGLEGIVGICIAHISHLLSALVLFSLTRALFPGSHSKQIALTTAFLHIISPAGLFLSAPCAESPCSLLSFFGSLLFTKSFASEGKSTISRDLLVVASGIAFGIATTFRSNGLLNGLFFVEEAFRSLLRLQYDFGLVTIRRLLVTVLGGICVAIGFLLPQYLAYTEFCVQSAGVTPRTWCHKALPSIYTFVQEYYWNVGFLRYWTLSNVPLFLLAAPMFAVLISSGIWGFNASSTEMLSQNLDGVKQNPVEKPVQTNALVRNMAVSQLLLTLLTLTGAHVQIITRISSSYPVWIWHVGHMAASLPKVEYLLRFMVIYAIVQGGLFASFLPPA